jgi:hypothetical protein
MGVPQETAFPRPLELLDRAPQSVCSRLSAIPLSERNRQAYYLSARAIDTRTGYFAPPASQSLPAIRPSPHFRNRYPSARCPIGLRAHIPSASSADGQQTVFLRLKNCGEIIQGRAPLSSRSSSANPLTTTSVRSPLPSESISRHPPHRPAHTSRSLAFSLLDILPIRGIYM